MSRGPITARKINKFFEGHEADVPAKVQITWHKAVRRRGSFSDSHKAEVTIASTTPDNATASPTLVIKPSDWALVAEFKTQSNLALSAVAKEAMEYVFSNKPDVVQKRAEGDKQYLHNKANGRYGPRNG